MIYFTGDLHGSYDFEKLYLFKQGMYLTKKDYLIIAGDFGLVWNNENSKYYDNDKVMLEWLSNEHYTTLFVPGNHENYDMLLSDRYPEVNMFGSKVKQIDKSVFMLQRGFIYMIDGLKVFTFGGAVSIDKEMRTEHVSWWKDEVPSFEEEQLALSNLEANNNTVDIIVTHATHKKMFDKMSFKYSFYEEEKDPLIKFLTEVQTKTSYKYWINGHYHIDLADKNTKTFALYNLIISHKEIMKRFYKE